jgi:hypothetical protein
MGDNGGVGMIKSLICSGKHLDGVSIEVTRPSDLETASGL